MRVSVKATKSTKRWHGTFTLNDTEHHLVASTLAALIEAASDVCETHGISGVEISLDTEYSDAKKGVDIAVAEAEAAAQAAYQIRRSVVRKMKADGLTHADIAQILGISHQRVSQLSV